MLWRSLVETFVSFPLGASYFNREQVFSLDLCLKRRGGIYLHWHTASGSKVEKKKGSTAVLQKKSWWQSETWDNSPIFWKQLPLWVSKLATRLAMPWWTGCQIRAKDKLLADGKLDTFSSLPIVSSFNGKCLNFGDKSCAANRSDD